MRHRKLDRRQTIPDNVIPLRNAIKPPINGYAVDGSKDAFLVRTDKIFFIAIVYQDNGLCYRSKGYVVFVDGASFIFGTGTGSRPQIHDKCYNMARHIARIYRGSLEKGLVDPEGRFQHDDCADKNADSGHADSVG